ncbi:MAG TPA: HAMP domain-containing sensor histidine kinase [Bacilli bacterium]
MTIRLRLTLWYSTILAITLLLFGVALYLFLSVQLNADAKETLRTYAMEVKGNIRKVEFPQLGLVKVELPPLTDFKYSDIYIQAYLSNGSVTRSSNLGTDLPISARAQDRILRQIDTFENASIGQYDLLIYNTPLLLNNNRVIGVLQVATVTNRIGSLLSTLQWTLIFLAVVTILLAATVGWFLAKKSLQPIDLVIASTNQIEKGADLGKRIAYSGPRDEIGRLTETINGMLDRIQSMYQELEEAYRSQRRFVSDASHELRTPLTTIRGNVELLQKMLQEGAAADLSREAISDISAEAARMSRLVNDLLSLARADAGYKMEKEWVEILPIVENASRRAQHLPRSADWRVGSLEALNDAHVFANRDYLEQLLFIFIENAFKYTEEGSVTLDALREAEQIGIRISDTGIGMDKEELPHIFERFYRADVSRGEKSGTGLGLSIAKWIVDEHHGSIEVKTRKNAGTTFIIWLPAKFSTDNEA